HDLIAEAIYGAEAPLGRLISGTVDTITPMTRDQIRAFYKARYVPSQMVVSAAGNLDHDRVVEMVAGAFDRSLAAPAQDARPAVRRPAEPPALVRPPRVVLRDKDTEQAHVILGCEGVGRHDERRFAVGVLNNVLGGGMSSRLFQEIREKRGLAYSV